MSFGKKKLDVKSVHTDLYICLCVCIHLLKLSRLYMERKNQETKDVLCGNGYSKISVYTGV
jgi:hypothetical protein